MRTRLITFLGAAAGILVTWFFLLYQPAANRQALLDAELAETQAKLEDYHATVADLPAILKQQNNLRNSRRELASKLFAKNDILDLFRQLDTDVRNHDLQITEISPPVHELLALNQKFQTPDDPLFLNIRLTIKGNFIDFGRYVEDLEQANYFRGVNRCMIGSSSVAGEPTTCTIDFRALLGSAEAAS